MTTVDGSDGSDEIGASVRARLTAQIAGMTEVTRTTLLPGIEHVCEAVERLCPAVMMTTPQGLRTAYGPDLGKGNFLVVLATAKRAVCVAVDELWEPGGWPSEAEARNCWHLMLQAMDRNDIEMAAKFTILRLGEAGYRKVCAVIREMQNDRETPAVVMIAGVDPADSNRVCGVAGVLGLPPRIEDQLASSGMH